VRAGGAKRRLLISRHLLTHFAHPITNNLPRSLDLRRTALINVRDRRRVYINADKNDVFDRLRNKSLGGTNSGVKTEEEAKEERNALGNLNVLDFWQAGLEDDLLLFERGGRGQGIRERGKDFM